MTITTVKVSILLMLHRLFAVTRLRFVLIAVSIFQVCWGIAFSMVFVFQCAPIQGAFSVSRSNCIDIYAALMVAGISNIIADIVILGLPIYIVRGLQMPYQKKLAVMGIFAIGGL